MKDKFKNGEMTIPVGAAIALVGFLISGISSYYVSQAKTDDKINETKSALIEDISDVKGRVSATEATVMGIDKRLERIENKLDQILKR